MKKIIISLIASVFCLNAEAGKLRIITEDAPPFNYKNRGQITGLSTDLVREITRRLGEQHSIEIMTWTKGYQLALSEPNLMLYSTTRTPEREKLFQWVGPVATESWIFYAKKGRKFDIKNLDDCKKVGSIGVYKDDVRESYLKQQGFKNLSSVNDNSGNLMRIIYGQIDLWLSDRYEAYQMAHNAGLPRDALEPVFTVSAENSLYLAFSLKTPSETVKRWQDTLDGLKKDGFFKKISEKWSDEKVLFP